MEKEYNEYIIRGLYGLEDGSPSSLEKMFKDNFIERFNTVFDLITVTSTNRVITESDGVGSIGIWIGSMTAKLVVDGESFSCTKDWGKEYDIDKLHPDYESDLYNKKELK